MSKIKTIYFGGKSFTRRPIKAIRLKVSIIPIYFARELQHRSKNLFFSTIH